MTQKWYRPADPVPGDAMAREHMCTPTGERREVRAGDWYLSGAIPTAYHARGDMHLVAPILRVARVTVETVTIIREVRS